MKATFDTTTQRITFTAEDERDIYDLGRLCEKTKTQAAKYPSEKLRLELSIHELLNTVLGK